MTREDLENYETNCVLEQEVIKIILDEADEEIESYINDLMKWGCQNGMVQSLVWYSDTLSFFKNFAYEINDLLTNTLDDIGFNSPFELFGKSWDREDNLCIETSNQNLLTWFAFEETTRRIALELGMEL